MAEQYYGIRVGITGVEESASKLQNLSRAMQKTVQDFQNYTRAIDSVNRANQLNPTSATRQALFSATAAATGQYAAGARSDPFRPMPGNLAGIDPSTAMSNASRRGAQLFDETFLNATRRMSTEIQSAINRSAGNFTASLERAFNNSAARLGAAQATGGALDSTMAQMLRVFEQRGYLTKTLPAPDPKHYGGANTPHFQEAYAKYEQSAVAANAARQFGMATDRGYVDPNDQRLFSRLENAANTAARVLETTFQKVTGTPYNMRATVEARDPNQYLRAMGISQVNAGIHYQATNAQLSEYERLTNMGVNDPFAYSRSMRVRDQYLDKHGDDPSLQFTPGTRRGFGGFVDDFTGGRGAGGYLARSAFRTATYVGEGSLLYGGMNLAGGAFRDILSAQEHQLRTGQIVSNPASRSQLSGGLEGLSRKYGVMPSEAYDIGFSMQAQFQNPTDALKGTQAVLLLSKTAAVSLTDAMKDLVAITNNYGTGAKGMQETVNGLVAVQNKFGGSIEQNIQALARLGPLFKEYGIDEATGTAYIQTIQRQTGTSGEEAASKLQRVLPQLQNSKTQEVLASIGVQSHLGIDATTFQGEIDAKSIISKVGAGVQDGRVSNAQLERIVTAMGGVRNAGDLVPLLTGGKMIRGITDTFNDGSKNGAAEARFEVVSKSALQQLAQFKSDFITLIKGISESGLLQSFTGLLFVMNQIAKVVSGTIGTINQFVSALGPIGTILKGVIGTSLLASVGGKYLNSDRVMGDTVLGGLIGKDAKDSLGQHKRDMTRRQYMRQVFGSSVALDGAAFETQREEYDTLKAARAGRDALRGTVGNEVLHSSGIWLPGGAAGAVGANAGATIAKDALGGNFARFIDGMTYLAIGPMRALGDSMVFLATKIRNISFMSMMPGFGGGLLRAGEAGFGSGGRVRTYLENFAVRRATSGLSGAELASARLAAQGAAGEASGASLLAGPLGLAAGIAGAGAITAYGINSLWNSRHTDASARQEMARQDRLTADSIAGIVSAPGMFGGEQRGEVYAAAAKAGQENYDKRSGWNHAGRFLHGLIDTAGRVVGEGGDAKGSERQTSLRFSQVDWSQFSKDDLKKLDVNVNKDGTFETNKSRWGGGETRTGQDRVDVTLAGKLADVQQQKDQDAYNKALKGLAETHGGGSALPVQLLDFMHSQDVFSSTFGGGTVNFTANAKNPLGGQSGMAKAGNAGFVETIKNTQDEIANINLQIDAAIRGGRDDIVKQLMQSKQKAIQDLDSLKNASNQANAAIGAFFGSAGVGAALKAAADAANYNNLKGDKNDPVALQRRLQALQSAQQAVSAPFDQAITASQAVLSISILPEDKIANLKKAAQLAQNKATALIGFMGGTNSPVVQQAMAAAVQANKSVLDAINQSTQDAISATAGRDQAMTGSNVKKADIALKAAKDKLAAYDEYVAQSKGLLTQSSGNAIIDKFVNSLMEQAKNQGDQFTTAAGALNTSASNLDASASAITSAANTLAGGATGPGGVVGPPDALGNPGQTGYAAHGNWYNGPGAEAPYGKQWVTAKTYLGGGRNDPSNYDTYRKLADDPSHKAPRGVLDGSTVAKILAQAGFSGPALETMVRIAKAESGYKTDAVNHNTNGTTDTGLFQINSIHKQFAGMDLNDPLQNAKAAYQLYKSGGFQPWASSAAGWDTSGALSTSSSSFKSVGGGGDTRAWIKNLVNATKIGGISVTSENTGVHAANSLHYKNEAIDFGGSRAHLADLAAALAKHPGSLSELIYQDPVTGRNTAVKNGRLLTQQQAIDTYSAKVLAEHRDHVHVGATPGQAGQPGGLADPTRLGLEKDAAQATIDRMKAMDAARAAERMYKAGPVGAYRQLTAQFEGARDAYRTAKTTGDTEGMFKAMAEMQKAQYDLAMQRASRIEVDMRLLGDSSNPIDAAKAKVDTVTAQMLAYLQGGGKKSDTEYKSLAASQKEANRDANLAKVDVGQQDVDYQYKMHRLGFGEYILKLTKLRDETNTSTRAGLEKWRSINESIQSLIDGLSQTFNIPTNIKTPTLYMVRRSLGAAGLNAGGMYPTGVAAPLNPSGPHAATGGRVSGAVLVGENGPEWFVPSVPGMILPHGESPGGGWQQKYTMAHPGSGPHMATGGMLGYTTEGIAPRQYIQNRSSQYYANGDPRMGGISGIVMPGAAKDKTTLKDLLDELKKIYEELVKIADGLGGKGTAGGPKGTGTGNPSAVVPGVPINSVVPPVTNYTPGNPTLQTGQTGVPRESSGSTLYTNPNNGAISVVQPGATPPSGATVNVGTIMGQQPGGGSIPGLVNQNPLLNSNAPGSGPVKDAADTIQFMTKVPVTHPDANGVAVTEQRAFSSFSKAAQADLRANTTVTGGDGRIFAMINGHATVVGFDPSVNAKMKHRASGGPVSGGTAYRVGENGPETFVPTGSGVVVPADVTGMMVRGLDSMRQNGVSNVGMGGQLGGRAAGMGPSARYTDASSTQITNRISIEARGADAKEVARLVAKAIGQGSARNARRNGSYTGAR